METYLFTFLGYQTWVTMYPALWKGDSPKTLVDTAFLTNATERAPDFLRNGLVFDSSLLKSRQNDF